MCITHTMTIPSHMLIKHHFLFCLLDEIKLKKIFPNLFSIKILITVRVCFYSPPNFLLLWCSVAPLHWGCPSSFINVILYLFGKSDSNLHDFIWILFLLENHLEITYAFIKRIICLRSLNKRMNHKIWLPLPQCRPFLSQINTFMALHFTSMFINGVY